MRLTSIQLAWRSGLDVRPVIAARRLGRKMARRGLPIALCPLTGNLARAFRGGWWRESVRERK